MFGTEDVILILFVAFLLFGEEKLPELARSLGKTVGEFKNAQRESEIRLKCSDKYANKDKNINNDIGKDTKIINLALEMGIDIEGKSSVQLIEEMRVKVKRERMWIKK